MARSNSEGGIGNRIQAAKANIPGVSKRSESKRTKKEENVGEVRWVVKVMSVMDDRGMLRREQNRGWGAKGVLDASGIRKYL